MVHMSTIVGFLGRISGSVVGPVTALAAFPAHQLVSFMDGVDDVWLVDAFLDQPDTADAPGS
ncbi:MAG: hypothetical protein JWM47_3928 [Acidimicrobiales bacterium]|nr:hypothetical protein [Acidimicrobiales bacterium]